MGPADTTKTKLLFRAALLAALPSLYQGRGLPHGRKIVRLRDLRQTRATGQARPGVFMDGNPANLSQPVAIDFATQIARISPKLWMVIELDDCLLPLDAQLRKLFCGWLGSRYGMKVPAALIEPPGAAPAEPVPALEPVTQPAPAAVEPPPEITPPEAPPAEPLAAVASQSADRGKRRAVSSQADPHGVRR